MVNVISMHANVTQPNDCNEKYAVNRFVADHRPIHCDEILRAATAGLNEASSHFHNLFRVEESEHCDGNQCKRIEIRHVLGVNWHSISEEPTVETKCKLFDGESHPKKGGHTSRTPNQFQQQTLQ